MITVNKLTMPVFVSERKIELTLYGENSNETIIVKADAIICLTHKAKSIILNWNFGIEQSKITVIPCCADLKHFSNENIDSERLLLLQHKYPQLKNKFYLISISIKQINIKKLNFNTNHGN